jgi:hypothetical protein
MLDTDNVLRYVCFMDEKGIITVRFWEREATSSFTEWLGLPRKQAFLFGGKYKICFEIEDVTTEFQLTEEEIERWMKAHPELREGKINLPTPIQVLNINEIRVGRKRYDNTQDFLQDYEAENYGIAYYQKEYERVNSEFLPLLMKYYDEKTRVVRREGEEETAEVAKSTPHFDILFVNEHIGLRASYLNDIVKRFINGEPMQVFHAGIKFQAPPFILGSMKIYNKIQLDSLTQEAINYYDNTDLQDKNLIALLQYVIFRRLAEINGQLPIAHFFEPLSQEIIKGLLLEGKLTKLEDRVLEYKSPDFLAGGNKEIISKLSEDLRKKLKRSPCKIYIIGVEDDGTLNPLPDSRLKSDRIETIRNGLQSELGIANIYALAVNPKGGGFLLLLIAAVHDQRLHLFGNTS